MQQRIRMIGAPASGKTTFARKCAAALQVPAVALDGMARPAQAPG